MFAIAVIGAFAAYAVVSLLVIGMVASFAAKRGRRGWVWGLGAAFVMYNLVFWDWLPTVYTHKYYCEKEAGFWVYKTLDQWKAENPGVMEGFVAEGTLRGTRVGDDENYIDTQKLNQRFSWVTERRHLASPLPVYRMERKIIDTDKGAAIARHVDYSTGRGRDYWKFWISNGSCPDGITNRNKLYHVVELIVNINKGEAK